MFWGNVVIKAKKYPENNFVMFLFYFFCFVSIISVVPVTETLTDADRG